jgi:putative lipoprotein
MDRRTALAIAPAALLLGGCGFGRGGAAPQFPPEVSGIVTYRERFVLPPDAELRVTLSETRGAAAEPKFIAEQTIPRPGQVPLHFRVAFPPSVIDARAGYSLIARIEIAGRTAFVNERPVPVLTLGNPGTVEIVVTKASGGEAR